jgi:hypothetical protein
VAGPERAFYRDGKEPAVVVEKEVIRTAQEIVLIPRWGMRIPFHVNSFVRKNDRASGAIFAKTPHARRLA